MKKWAALIGMGVLGVGMGVVTTRASAPKTLTGTDYGEIQALYARYNYAVDSSNPEMYGGVFTPDGEFVAGERTLKGRKAIGAIAQGRGPVKARPTIHHVGSSVLIEPSAEGAKGSSYVVLMDLSKNPAISGGGVYEDVIVRTSEGWRFKKRTYFAEPAPPPAPAPAR
jgi:hypothetical protein